MKPVRSLPQVIEMLRKNSVSYLDYSITEIELALWESMWSFQELQRIA